MKKQQSLSWLAVAVASLLIPHGETAAQAIDFQDGVAGNPIGSFYLARGVFFDNARWDPLFGSPTNLLISTVSVHPFGGHYSPTPEMPIVVTFATPVSWFRIDGVDVGGNGVRIDAYDAPVGGRLVDFQEEFGFGDGEEVIIPVSVSAPVIRRIALYQPQYGVGDGIVFDNLSFGPVSTATVLQSFDRLFQGDDPTEGFGFSLPPDPSVASTVRFVGFAENRDPFVETGARFNLGWGRTEGSWDGAIRFPEEPAYYLGVRLPAADAAGGPARVPVEFQASIGYSPASVRLTVEGLGCCDNVRFVGNLTIEYGPRLRVSRIGNAAAQITWTTNFAGCLLEEAAALPALVWTAATNTVSVVGGDYSVTVDTTAAAQRVYRLRKP